MDLFSHLLSLIYLPLVYASALEHLINGLTGVSIETSFELVDLAHDFLNVIKRSERIKQAIHLPPPIRP